VPILMVTTVSQCAYIGEPEPNGPRAFPGGDETSGLPKAIECDFAGGFRVEQRGWAKEKAPREGHSALWPGHRLGDNLLDERDDAPAHICISDTTECEGQLDTLGRGKKPVQRGDIGSGETHTTDTIR
jgi:hypothetical protein